MQKILKIRFSLFGNSGKSEYLWQGINQILWGNLAIPLAIATFKNLLAFIIVVCLRLFYTVAFLTWLMVYLGYFYG